MKTHADLMCRPKTVEYDWRSKRGILSMEGDDCTDMQGCIAFFERIDPEVTLIITKRSGNRIDTCYRRKTPGQWEAYAHLT